MSTLSFGTRILNTTLSLMVGVLVLVLVSVVVCIGLSVTGII
ncbi:MAG: hypothetical protein OIF50_03360 [Flavobacteriaceae bacterium]|nr:hypothetical protein [Flavobacteriaceae bacterium]